MKAAHIAVGGDYTCKVSGRVVPVRVLEILEQLTLAGRSRTTYRCRNLVTSREINVRSCQRFRMAAQHDPESAIGRSMMETREQP